MKKFCFHYYSLTIYRDDATNIVVACFIKRSM